MDYKEGSKLDTSRTFCKVNTTHLPIYTRSQPTRRYPSAARVKLKYPNYVLLLNTPELIEGWDGRNKTDVIHSTERECVWGRGGGGRKMVYIKY